MNPERERAAERICHAALERPAVERTRFVVEACGADADLRREVEALLTHADAASAFLETPALAIAAQGIATRGPALNPGERVGSYTILGALGSGGMGDVYRARDATLGRDVAIKVLPPVFTSDAERLARFEREARVLASLNHPNIAHIHGLADADGVRAFVMELVEGPTLADRIARGPIPVNESLPIAKQIAEALEAAHEHGIIHRDLKPANIKVRPDGIVKVLDFGLAKAVNRQGAASVDATRSPTMSVDATTAGVILGTAAYMAPEQARGQTIDKRSDVWAFGCVLYEMLTGRQAFAGEDLAGILACVLEREPDWTRLPASVPTRVRDLLRLCLEKNPKHRRRDAGDVRIDLERAMADPAADPGAVFRTPRTSRVAWLVSAAAIVAAVMLAIPAMRYLRQTAAPSVSEVRANITSPPGSAPLEFALSPDFRQIVFVASGDGRPRLWLQALNDEHAQPLPGTDGAAYPFWSADSRSIAYVASRKLYRIDLDGGSPRELADVAASARGGTWNADGTIVFAAGLDRPLMRVDANGGEPVAVTRLDPPRQTNHHSPQFLADGRHFLFLAVGNQSGSGIYLGSLDGTAPKRLMASDVAAGYIEPDLVVYVEHGALVARRLDVVRGELTGASMTLAEAVGYDSVFRRAAFSVSAAGHLAYQSRMKRDELYWVDRTGQESIIPVNVLDVNRLANPDLSPDGRRLAVTLDSQRNVDIWLMDREGSRWTRFTSDRSPDAFPVWSKPDGNQIVFSSLRAGTSSSQLYVKSSNGTAAESVLLDHDAFPQDWSTDGRFLMYMVNDPKTGRDLWALDVLDKHRTPRAVANTSFAERNGQFSPDRQLVAYETDESGRPEIMVVPFPEVTEKRRVSTNGGTQPRWRPDGKELYYVALDGKLMAVSITIGNELNGSKIRIGSPEFLFATRLAGSDAAQFKAQYAVSRDGRFLISQPESTATPITLIMNWKPPAKSN